MTAAISGHALHILVCARLTLADGSSSRGLADVWTAASSLGITHPLAGDIPTDLPAQPPADDVFFRVVAAKAGPDGRDNAVAFSAHDVAGVVVRLCANPQDAATESGWDGLAGRWRRVCDPSTLVDVFRTIELFTGVADVPGSGDQASRVLAAQADSGVASSVVVEPGVELRTAAFSWGWRVVALAGTAAAPAVAAWCSVSPTGQDAGKLVRYFMQASKLRFEADVFKEDIVKVRRKMRDLDDDIDDVFALHAQLEDSGAPPDEMVDLQSRLGRAQGDASGLVFSLSRLRDLRETLQIIEHNLRAHQPTAVDSTPPASSPFAGDLELAEWLGNQIRSEIAYLESIRERAGEARKLTELRLQQLSAANDRKANWLRVLQTSLIAAPLGVLSVAGTIGSPIKAPDAVVPAVMGLAGSTTLFLPLLAMRWVDGYRWPDIAAVALIGCCLGWLTAVLMPAGRSPAVMLAAALLGAVLLGGAAVLGNGRRGAAARGRTGSGVDKSR